MLKSDRRLDGVGACAVPERMSQVVEQLNNVNDAISALQGIVVRTHDRFGSVISQDQSATAKVPVQAEQHLVPLADELRSMASKIRIANDHLQSIVEACEL